MIWINCDLGEWESLEETQWIMQRIDMANVACGEHAGSALQIEKCSEWASEFGVNIGMHPGVKGEKGRGDVSTLHKDVFIRLLTLQYDYFEKYAGKPEHLKLHGSLYHLSEKNEEIREALLHFVVEKKMRLLCLANGRVWNDAQSLESVEVLGEAFLDRGYLPSGELVRRSERGAVIEDLVEVQKRFDRVMRNGGIYSVCKKEMGIHVDTFCVHSDSDVCKQFLSQRIASSDG